VIQSYTASRKRRNGNRKPTPLILCPATMTHSLIKGWAAVKQDSINRWVDNPDCQRVEVLKQHCKELGMDCSVFVLSHNDLGPTNIIVNGNRIVVLDWEMAGYAVKISFLLSRRLPGHSIPDSVFV
jgi:thiamine kinase-like enzyme